MPKVQIAEPILSALQSPKFNADQQERLRNILTAEISMSSNAAQLLESVDVSEKKTWPFVITLARMAKISDDEMQYELGASASTLHRWVKEGVAPREGTRKLMRGALVVLAKEKVQGLKALEKKLSDDSVKAKGRTLQDA